MMGPEAYDVEALAAILQRLADASGVAYLLVVEPCPKREYRNGQPYGVEEPLATPHERTNHARRIVPQAAEGKGPTG